MPRPDYRPTYISRPKYWEAPTPQHNFVTRWLAGHSSSQMRDHKLELELAEHALLLGLGWRWGTKNGEFFWMAPPGHKGTQVFYQSRAHAINSIKKHTLGQGKDNYRDAY